MLPGKFHGITAVVDPEDIQTDRQYVTFEGEQMK